MLSVDAAISARFFCSVNCMKTYFVLSQFKWSLEFEVEERKGKKKLRWRISRSCAFESFPFFRVFPSLFKLSHLNSHIEPAPLRFRFWGVLKLLQQVCFPFVNILQFFVFQCSIFLKASFFWVNIKINILMNTYIFRSLLHLLFSLMP